MKLWYRCAMCSPDQSKDFDVDENDPPVSKVYGLVAEHHKVNSPNCPASKDTYIAVEVMLVRMVQ